MQMYNIKYENYKYLQENRLNELASHIMLPSGLFLLIWLISH